MNRAKGDSPGGGELQCIDAYFYIMSMRFGQRLSIERKIDDDLLYLMVPPLILQPIVEKCDCTWGGDCKKTASSGFYAVYHDEEKCLLKSARTCAKR